MYNLIYNSIVCLIHFTFATTTKNETKREKTRRKNDCFLYCANGTCRLDVVGGRMPFRHSFA